MQHHITGVTIHVAKIANYNCHRLLPYSRGRQQNQEDEEAKHSALFPSKLRIAKLERT